MVDEKSPSELFEAPDAKADKTAKYLRLLAVRALSGFAFSIFFVAMLLAFDIASLRTLIFASQDKWISLFILTFFLGLTFGSVQMGIAIMNKFGKDDDDDDKHGRGPKLPDLGAFLEGILTPPPEPQPIRVKARRLY